MCSSIRCLLYTSYPVIAAGGNCSFNPEPLADIIDFFMPGDGEDVLIEVSEAIIAHKKSGGTKRELLEKLSKIDGIYVPSFYEPQYGEDGILTGYRKLYDGAPDQVVKRIVMDMDAVSFPVKPLVPFVDAVSYTHLWMTDPTGYRKED